MSVSGVITQIRTTDLDESIEFYISKFQSIGNRHRKRRFAGDLWLQLCGFVASVKTTIPHKSSDDAWSQLDY